MSGARLADASWTLRYPTSSHAVRPLSTRRGGAPLWGTGFLSASYQGVPFLRGKDPILNLSTPDGFDHGGQRDFVETVNDLNAIHIERVGDPDIRTRIAAYEVAYRMQSTAPELMDLAGETQETLDLYGVDPARPDFARNCLLARRLVEKGVRFVQLYHTDWDHHPNLGRGEALETSCREVDRSAAALVTDLKRRGLLEDTLVIWGGEFGRTPQGEIREKGKPGRDHHIESGAVWLAGGGVRSGAQIGRTDELGYYPVEDEVHVHDLHATILHLLGLDHERLTFRPQGRDFRLTDVYGRVLEKLLA